MKLRAASCFSGIMAPELGMPQYEWIWHAEIEKFPCAVGAARFPDSVNLGDVLAPDFIERARALGPLDLLCGGPPCQAFSVAGLRQSLADARGNLTLRWVQILHAILPRNAVTENVPGWLNTDDNAFGCFLGAVIGGGYPLVPGPRPARGKSNDLWRWQKRKRWRDRGRRKYRKGRHIATWPSSGMVAGPRARAAWRILDAQYFGVAQRRERVFVVIDFGEGADPAEVLFERKSVLGNHPPSREKGKAVAALSASGVGVGGADDNQAQAGHLIHAIQAGATRENPASGPDGVGVQADIAYTLEARPEVQAIAHTLRGEGFDATEDGTGRGIPIVPVAYRSTGNSGVYETGDRVGALTNNRDPNSEFIICPDVAPTLPSNGDRQYGDFETAGGLVADVAPVAFRSKGGGDAYETGDVTGSLTADPRGHLISGSDGGMAVPLDLRNALRDGDKHDEQNRQGVGVGEDGDPSGPLTTAFVSGVITGEPVCFSAADSGQDAGTDIAPTMRAMAEKHGNANGGGQLAVAVFDPNQITSATNRSVPEPEVCHTLPAKADPPVAYSVALRGREGGGTAEIGEGDVAHTLRASQGGGDQPHVLVDESFPQDISPPLLAQGNETGGHRPPGSTVDTAETLVPVTYSITPSNSNKDFNARPVDRAQTVHTKMGEPPGSRGGDVVLNGAAVRKLMPVECHRLQGFPDLWCQIIYRGKPAADGPVYRALGNSWAVPVGGWIGRRLHAAQIRVIMARAEASA